MLSTGKDKKTDPIHLLRTPIRTEDVSPLITAKDAHRRYGPIATILIGAIIVASASFYMNSLQNKPVQTYTYAIIHAYPHDPTAFTQGLVFDNGFLYEGTGLRGQSSLRRVELESGNVLQVHSLSSEYFGEGITIHQDKIFQVTWRSHEGFVYDMDSFELIDAFEIATEGWGLTHDGSGLILSDGTSTLRFIDLDTYEETRAVEVRDRDGPVFNINELEYIDGEVFANIWQTERIARIDPESGSVVGWLDLSGIADSLDENTIVDVLNGIAYDVEGSRLFVTGKLWPMLFEIEIIPMN
jgi:glutamine cyclotransferase